MSNFLTFIEIYHHFNKYLPGEYPSELKWIVLTETKSVPSNTFKDIREFLADDFFLKQGMTELSGYQEILNYPYKYLDDWENLQFELMGLMSRVGELVRDNWGDRFGGLTIRVHLRRMNVTEGMTYFVD